MARWLPGIRSKLRGMRASDEASHDASAARRSSAGSGDVLELLVLEGLDAGRRFTLDSAVHPIGHGEPQPGGTDRILLRDASIALEEARIERRGGGYTLESIGDGDFEVNGERHDRHLLMTGDRIRLGSVLLEVRARDGVSLSGFFEVPPLEGAAPESTLTSERTETRPLDALGSHLIVVRGIEGWEDRLLWLSERTTRLGRSPDAEIQIPESGVSRRHAEIVRDPQGVVLFHRSRVNPTFVNGEPVVDRRRLADGDEIQLADRVLLRLRLSPEDMGARAPLQRSLREYMEDSVRRDREIEEAFRVKGSFLDVDIVDSFGLKAREVQLAAQKIVSFERFRRFVGECVEEHDGLVLNSNGDELMCFFEDTLQAVRAGSQLLVRLAEFNREQNQLSAPFRVRCGVHSGDSLVDRVRGVAYSEVLDVAGHLQKQAPIDGMLVSEATHALLPPGLPFEEASKLERAGLRTYRLTEPLD